MKEPNCKKIIRDRLNTLKSRRSQYTTEKMSKRIAEDKVQEYNLLIEELKNLLDKL